VCDARVVFYYFYFSKDKEVALHHRFKTSFYIKEGLKPFIRKKRLAKKEN